MFPSITSRTASAWIIAAVSLLAMPGLEQPARAQNQQGWTRPDWMMSKSEVEQYRRSQLLSDRSALRSTNPGNTQSGQIRTVVHFYLSDLVASDPKNLPRDVTERLLTFELGSQLTSPRAREVAMEEILKIVPDVLNHPDDIVRFNAMSLVTQLSSKPATYQGTREIPAVPYNPMYRLLIRVVSDQDQSLAVRISAARGLLRVCRDGENAPSSTERSDIATALVQALSQTEPSTDAGVSWFRNLLIKALGYVDRIDNTGTEPIVLDSLLGVISNRREVWSNRAMAAQSISQLPLNSQTNLQLITHEIAKLTHEMAVAYRKSPRATFWQESFIRVYLSFKPAQGEQATQKLWGLIAQTRRTGLGSNEDYVQGAWLRVFALTSPFLQRPEPSISEKAIDDLQKWLDENTPSSRQVHPGGRVFAANDGE